MARNRMAHRRSRPSSTAQVVDAARQSFLQNRTKALTLRSVPAWKPDPPVTRTVRLSTYVNSGSASWNIKDIATADQGAYGTGSFRYATVTLKNIRTYASWLQGNTAPGGNVCTVIMYIGGVWVPSGPDSVQYDLYPTAGSGVAGVKITPSLLLGVPTSAGNGAKFLEISAPSPGIEWVTDVTVVFQ